MADFNKINDAIIYIVLGAVVITVSLLLLYGGKGAEDIKNITSFWTYGIMGFITTIAIAALMLKRPKDKIPYFDAGVHDPEESPLGKIEIIRNPAKLFLISLILFTIAGMIAVSLNFFANIPSFQISPLVEINLQSLLPAWAETALLVFVFFIVRGVFMKFLIERATLPRNSETKLLAGFITAILVGTMFFPTMHRLIYADQEQDLLATAGLGTSCTATLALTGSIIPCWVHHNQNNLFKAIKTLFANEVAYLIGILIVILLLMAYYLLFIRKKKVQ